jgi:hypothetical protein
MLENLQPAPKITTAKQFRPGIEFDGIEGTAVTPGYASEPENFNEFLISAGFDPDTIDVVGPIRTSRWQQREDGPWLTSYRFTFRQRTATIDLPLLFSEATKRAKLTKPALTKNGKAFVICPADFQIGKTGSRGGTPETIERVLRSYERIEAHLKKNKYEQILILDVGDVIESFSSAANFNQLAGNDLSPMQQTDVAASLLWRLLKLASKYAPVKMGSVASNHCQNRFNGQQVGKPGLDDWGIVILQQLRRLSEEVGLNVQFFVPHPEEEVFTIDVFDDGFHHVAVAHGHQAKRPDQIPTYWRQMTFGNSSISGASILVTGHFHHTRLQELGESHNKGSRWWIQCSTSDAGSDWFKRMTGEDSMPAITCFELEKQKHYQGQIYRF